MATYYKQNVPSHLHVRMKNLAELSNNTIIQEYENAIEAWLAQRNQDVILADSKILSVIESRLTKMEDRLVRMNGRMSMDVAMSLMGTVNMLAKKYNVSEGDIMKELRPIAAQHFSKSRKDPIEE